MPSLPALEFNNVSKQYRGFFRSQWATALRDFSLRVETGEIFGFRPNGAGRNRDPENVDVTRRGMAQCWVEFLRPYASPRVGFLAETSLSTIDRRPAGQFYGALNSMRDPSSASTPRDAKRI
jgi:hypothetical protein